MRCTLNFRCPIAFVTVLTAACIAAPVLCSGVDIEKLLIGEVRVIGDVEEDEANITPERIAAISLHLDQLVFGGADKQRIGRQYVQACLKLRMHEITGACRLSNVQIEKLRLAASMDSFQIFGELDQLTLAFLKANVQEIEDEKGHKELRTRLDLLHARANSGVFGAESLFHKVAQHILDARQAAIFQETSRERRAFRYRASVEMTIALLDEKMLLREDQRQSAIRLLIQETEPPYRFGNLEYELVLFKLSKLPEEKVRAIFDDEQWPVLVREFQKLKDQQDYLIQASAPPSYGPPATDPPPATGELLLSKELKE